MKTATPGISEQRVILSNISWQTFEQLLNELGEDRATGVPELWRYDGNKLEIFVLQASNQDYQLVNQSPTFPWMPIEVIPRFIRQSLVDGETATLRAFRAWVREQQNQ